MWSWRTSDLVPMGGRIIIERLRCGKGTDLRQSEAYIRFIINDGIVAVGDDEYGGMTTVANFQRLLRESGEAVGDFKEMRGLAPSRITLYPSVRIAILADNCRVMTKSRLQTCDLDNLSPRDQASPFWASGSNLIRKEQNVRQK